jgi:hypothetical protein
METAPVQPPMPPTTWFGKNWKWVVPVGCLLPVLFLGGCALAIFFFAMGVLKQSDAYKTALARAQTNPAVIEAIGSPISQTGIVAGSSNVNAATGQAKLSIPLRGPKGKATLYVEARKSADVWLFQTLVVKIEKTGQQIDLNLGGTTLFRCLPRHREARRRRVRSDYGLASFRSSPTRIDVV